MNKNILIIILIIVAINSYSQIGINTNNPDSSAILDLKSTTKGLLIPTLSTTERMDMIVNKPSTGLANSLLVYDADLKKFFFWNRDSVKWSVLNNWRKEYTNTTTDNENVYVNLESNSNVGINIISPKSKVTVERNLSVGNSNSNSTDLLGMNIDGQVQIGQNAGNTNKFEVDGDISTIDTLTANTFVGRGIIPVGGIIMKSGSISGLFNSDGIGESGTTMDGWAICNGYSSLSPDLRNLFVVGVTNVPNQSAPALESEIDIPYNIDNIGGYDFVTLVLSELPIHSHSISISGVGNHQHNLKTFDEMNDYSGLGSSSLSGDGSVDDNTSSNGSHSHTFTTPSEGGDASHENRPLFYAVYYIIRIN